LRSVVVPLVFALPGVPWCVAWMAARLPKWPVRGPAADVDGLADYGYPKKNYGF
jgi:hypothetical protein